MTEKAKPTVVEALSAVMEDVQAVGKGQRNQQQGYSFRGVDAVVNAVGPALRKHGVIVVPVSAEADFERYQTKSGAVMRGCTLTVGFRFYGPAGDYIDATACGESSDSGDKSVPKAHSVAYRTLLLQALCIPTDEPDPDSESHERVRPASPEPEAKATNDGQTSGSAAGSNDSVLEAEIAQLRAELLEGADKLGAKAATEEAIGRNRAEHAGDLPKHRAWLKRQIVVVKKNLAAKQEAEEQKPLEAA